nr:zinc finger, CCHC-type [Tanacetum cinerariifolium]
DKLNYLEQPIPPVPVAPAGQQVALEILAAHNAWVKGLKEIAGLMLMTMKLEIQRNLEPLHAHEMLKEQEEGQSVSSYVLKMKGYIDNLERLGNPETLGLGVSLILIGLRKEYDGFVQNYNMHSMGKTVNELHAMLKLHEKTLPKSNAPALNAIRDGKPKIPPPPKKENPAKDSICHEYGEIGHWKRDCPQYLAELMKKKKNTASGACGSGIFGLKASRKLKLGALSLYVGNGQREAVEAIGAFYLCLPSGLEIVLNNCHYAPSIPRGVISASRLDGIFEIDLSNSLTNESSVYAVSNKRAKLDLDSKNSDILSFMDSTNIAHDSSSLNSQHLEPSNVRSSLHPLSVSSSPHPLSVPSSPHHLSVPSSPDTTQQFSTTNIPNVVEANGYENFPFGERDCRNYIAKMQGQEQLTSHLVIGIVYRHMVKILIKKDVKELLSRYILSRWRKDVKHRYNFITNCYDDLKSREQVKQFDHLCANFYEAANIVDSPEKYEYLMKCLDEAKEKLIDASSWGVNHVSNSNEEELLPPWKVRGRGRPPKRKKSTIEKLTEKQRNKNKKNASQGKKDKLPAKRGSSMSI